MGLLRPFAELLAGRKRCLKIHVEVVYLYISDGVGIDLFSHIFAACIEQVWGQIGERNQRGKRKKEKKRAVGPAKVKAVKQN